MITETDKLLAAKFMPNAGDARLEAGARDIAKAMLPERQALADLVSRLEQIGEDPSFRQVFESAKSQGVFFRGKPWKEELDRAKEIVNTYPVPEIQRG
jgi:hypothetical protein